jgi:hypothetical protein
MSTGKKHPIAYYDDDWDDLVSEETFGSGWSEAFTRWFTSRPEPEIIPCFSLERLSLQREHFSDWAYSQMAAYKRAQQRKKDPSEHQTQASTEDFA